MQVYHQKLPKSAFPNKICFYRETVITQSGKNRNRSYAYMSEQTISFKIDLRFQVEWIILQQSWLRLIDSFSWSCWSDRAGMHRGCRDRDGGKFQVRTETL